MYYSLVTTGSIPALACLQTLLHFYCKAPVGWPLCQAPVPNTSDALVKITMSIKLSALAYHTLQSKSCSKK